MRNRKDASCIQYILYISVFLICLYGAMGLPVSQCPDEEGRLLLVNWMCRTGKLPTGNELETMIPGWGFSYALRPFLPAMFSAVFVRIAMLFTNSEKILLAAARMSSVLSNLLTCWYCFHIGNKLFKKESASILYSIVVCFLPQMMFIGMYHNNDAPALAGVSALLYYLLLGNDEVWSIRSCVGIAVSISVILLTYYSVFGWIIAAIIFCFASVIKNKNIKNKIYFITKRVLMILGICMVLAGWFYIRNALIHDGSVFGIAAEMASRERMEASGHTLYNYYAFRDEGLSLGEFVAFRNGEWWIHTIKSFIGVFGYMTVYLPGYKLYFFIIGFNCMLYLIIHSKRLKRDDNSLFVNMMFIACCMTILMSFWQSYTRDYQPQGRYIISCILFIGYVITYSTEYWWPKILVVRNLNDDKKTEYLCYAASTIWILMFFKAVLTMAKMIV